MVLSLFLLLLPASLPAIDTVELQIDRLQGAEWQLEGVRLSVLSPASDTTSYSLTIGKLTHPALKSPIMDVLLNCRIGALHANRIGCRDGTLLATHNWFKRSKIDFKFSFNNANQSIELSMDNIRSVFGEYSLVGQVVEDSWSADLRGEKIPFHQLKNTFPAIKQALSDVTLDFTALGELKVSGKGANPLKAHWNIQFDDLAFQDASERYLGEGLAGRFKGGASYNNHSWLGSQSIDLNGGALLTPYFYLEPAASLISLSADYQFKEQSQRFEFHDIHYQHAGIFSFNGSGIYQFGDEKPGLSRLRIDTGLTALAKLYESYLEPVLADTVLEAVDLSGNLRLSLNLDDYQPERGHLELQNVYIEPRKQGEETANLFALYGLDGVLNWSHDSSAGSSSLGWQAGHLFETLEIGESQLSLILSGNNIALEQQASIPVLDGALQAETFSASFGEKGLETSFSGYLTPISMERLSQALGWPVMTGQLSGMIPGMTYEKGVISVDGTALMRIFDGQILIKDLVLEDLFQALPVLTAQITLKSLDLETLTKTFSFGKITGRLDGRINGLRLEDWSPISFDAVFATPEGDASRHRISQKAVDNISNLGGAGVSGALSRSFLRFFEEFRYNKLGISCRLENGICEMGGIEPKANGYYLVKGSGIPRIDIMGFNKQTDWDLLIRKLKQMTGGQAPVIE